MIAVAFMPRTASAYDVSQPAMIQFFESSWTNMRHRAPDLFMAGYGHVWIPPVGRADSGNHSVGYDVYDRFDLGSAGNPTLYGTENTLRRAITEMHQSGLNVYADGILNHDGFNDQSNVAFANSGAYPGFVLSASGAPYGDFHAPQSLGDNYLTGRLAGLIDINHASNHRYVRNPIPNATDANGNALRNIPAGTVPHNGRIANVAAEANRRFYVDRHRAPDRMLFNPTTGQSDIPVWDFTPDTAVTGDAIEENATQYLMRNAQWMLQSVGVDGFRLDAAKHFPVSVLNDSYDRAVYRANPRLNLDGSQKQVFSFSEVYDGSRSFIQNYIRKDINPADPGRVGGNRDVLDFPLFFSMQSNLSGNGLSNDWRNVVNASQDVQDDGLANNGSQGVAFATSHDDGGVYLSNVAHAYMLMRPGNAVVYFNAKQFGEGRDFPKDGRGDALGGFYGDAVTTLTNLRNTHGRGNYIERWINKENLIYERDKSAIVALSNRIDGGFDTYTIQTNFAAGTRLIESTGNAASTSVDPSSQIADYVVVDAQGRVTLNVPRNRNVNGVEHDNGYVIYTLPTPRGTLEVQNRSATVAGGVPTASTNGTTRLASMDVVTSDAFTIRMQTTPVVIGGYHDVNAGGDGAVFSVNGGVGADGMGNDLNGNGLVDYRTPGSVVYGFEEFLTKASPLVGGGDGEFLQTIDATKLIEGFNYLEVRAFRSRPANEPPVYSSFKKVVYVDRLPAETQLAGIVSAGGNDRALRVTNADGTVDSVHAFIDLGAALTDAQIIALVDASNAATQIDAGLFSRTFANVGSGNHNLVHVSYEPSGRVIVSRVAGQYLQTGRGRGLGDTNFDGSFTAADVGVGSAFEVALYSRNTQFNAASDLNADGFVDNRDLLLLPELYQDAAATGAFNEARAALVRRANVNGDAITSPADIDLLYTKFGAGGDIWLYDLDVNGAVGKSDLDTMVTDMLFTRFGDTNLDRRVDFSDLLRLAQGYGQAGTWLSGDFNGDQFVNFNDLLAIAQNYGFVGLISEGSNDADPHSSFAADFALLRSHGFFVPEPASVTGVLLGGTLMRRRRHP